MLKVVENKSIFTSRMKALVNPVNCVGVMGSGLAREFRIKYPAMFEQYKYECKQKLYAPGDIHIWKNDSIIILNAATKDDWRFHSRIEWVEKCLDKFVARYQQRGIESVAFPLLGCSGGGLQPEKIFPLMKNKLESLPISVEIYVKYVPWERI